MRAKANNLNDGGMLSSKTFTGFACEIDYDIHMPTMTCYHVTPRVNEASIRQRGILGDTVWLVARRNIPWALAHTERRHCTPDLSIIAVRVQRGNLTRYRKGIYKHAGPVYIQRLL